jgi:hypothetical protein
MNRDARVALPKVNIPKTGTLTKMHPRRKAKAKDRRQKSLRYRTRMRKSSAVFAANTKRRRIHREI